MRILHLSDVHIPRRGGVDQDGVDARAILGQLLHDCRHVQHIDLVVVSGDIADDGSAEGYTDARDLVGAFAADRHVPHVYCTGNHDDRATFASVLGTGHVDPDGRDVGDLMPGGTGERAAVSIVGGYRVITLDSLVPGEVHGRVGDAQLAWLRELLRAPAANGSIVVLHHPPITLDLDVQKAVGLQNPLELSEALRGSDVLAVLCGHFHVQITGQLDGVVVWVAPGVVTRIDLTAPDGIERAVRGAAATVVDLGGPSAPMFHVLYARDLQAGRTVYLVDSASGADVESEEATPPPPDRPVSVCPS